MGNPKYSQLPTGAVSATAEALTEIVRARYGHNLTGDQLTAVRRTIEADLQSVNRLKQVNLSNGDEPAFVFSADIT